MISYEYFCNNFLVFMNNSIDDAFNLWYYFVLFVWCLWNSNINGIIFWNILNQNIDILWIFLFKTTFWSLLIIVFKKDFFKASDTYVIIIFIWCLCVYFIKYINFKYPVKLMIHSVIIMLKYFSVFYFISRIRFLT